MDGQLDEACVIRFDGAVSVVQAFTTSKDLLLNAMNNLQIGDKSACWDGIYEGILEVIRAGTNPCRSVIVCTDGVDNASVHSPEQIISLATRNRMRVYTICLGSAGGTTSLEWIATSTGGKYHHGATEADIYEIFSEISTTERVSMCCEYMIAYNAKCMDGSKRTVELKMKNVCNGSDQKTKTYTAPKDTSTFANVHISLGANTVKGGGDLIIPLLLDGPINGGTFEPATFTIPLDNPVCGLQFQKIEAPPGSILDGIPITVSFPGNSVQIRTTQRIPNVQGSLLAELTFATSPLPDTCKSEIGITSWSFDRGCFTPVLHPAKICILPIIYDAKVSYDGRSEICEGENLILTASSGFESYVWSPNGETTTSITVRQSGDYWFKGIINGGDQFRSNTIRVKVNSSPPVRITPQNGAILCAGDSVVLDAGAGYASYQWSNGEYSQTIVVRGAGVFSVSVIDYKGCTGISEPVAVTIKPLPEVTLKGGTICDGDSVLLDAGGGFAAYAWSTGEAGRSIVVRKAGTYSVRVTDPTRCTAVSTSAVVYVKPLPAAPTITRQGDVLTASQARLYQWYKDGKILPGETGRSLAVKDNGRYTVQVFDDEGGCSAMAESIDVITAIETISSPAFLDIFPDPHDGVFTVRLATPSGGAVQLRVIDILGRLVFERAGLATQSEYRVSIDISAQPSGMYWVRIGYGGRQVSRMVVKK
jgi:hypothetical protein